MASVGLSVQTSMQTDPVGQQKAASVIYLSKTFFKVILVTEVQARGSQGEQGVVRALRGGPTQKPQRWKAGDKKCHGCRCLYIVRAVWRIVLVVT